VVPVVTMLATVSLFAATSAITSAPTWPPPISAVWPTQWASLNYTGDFPYGPPPFDKVTLTGSWWFDWPTNRWRQDTCFTGMGPGTSCKVELWDGNNRRAGQVGVGTTFTWKEGKCTYVPSLVPSITHPDSFAKADHTSRSLVDSKWSDTWVSNTAPWIHFNFSTTMDITTGLPVRDCGPTIPQAPWAYACSRHHNPKFAAGYSSAEWAAFFALDTTACTAASSKPLAEPSGNLQSVWPGALMASTAIHFASV
jgi:hypothetical protein